MSVRVVLNRSGLASVRQATTATLGKIAGEIADDMRQDVPVDTGFLKSSIDHKVVSEDTAIISATAPYALYVEYDQPFMRPSTYKKRGR